MSADQNLSPLPLPLDGVRVIRLATVAFFLVSQLQKQAEQLAENGAEILLVSDDGPELARLRLGRNLRHAVVPFERAIRPWQDFKALLMLILLFHRERPHIVHSTTPKAGLLAAIAGFLTHVPIRLHTFTGQPWINLRGTPRWFARAADRLICRLNTHVYADSASQRQFLVDEGIVKPASMDVLGAGSLAGVDTERFSKAHWSKPERVRLREQHGVLPQSRVIVFLGRITQEKGIRELLSAFEMLCNHGMDCHLFLVGPSDADCGGSDKQFSVKPYVSSRIHAPGYTDCPERYLVMADVLCLPSYREGFGTVVIEAAAMGVPTVGTRINGLRDAIVDGETGVLVNPRDPLDLHAALSTLLGSSVHLENLGRAAQKRALSLFDARTVNRLLQAEYSRQLVRKGWMSGATAG